MRNQSLNNSMNILLHKLCKVFVFLIKTQIWQDLWQFHHFRKKSIICQRHQVYSFCEFSKTGNVQWNNSCLIWNWYVWWREESLEDNFLIAPRLHIDWTNLWLYKFYTFLVQLWASGLRPHEKFSCFPSSEDWKSDARVLFYFYSYFVSFL